MRSPGECQSGELHFEQHLGFSKVLPVRRPPVCTSARPVQKHFFQEPGRMPIRRIAFRTAPGIFKVLPVREACGLHFGPAGSKALRLGARANANPENCISNGTWDFQSATCPGGLRFAHRPGRFKRTSIRSPGECQPGELHFEQDLGFPKCYLSGRPPICTSARPVQKHFFQEPGRPGPGNPKPQKVLFFDF